MKNKLISHSSSLTIFLMLVLLAGCSHNDNNSDNDYSLSKIDQTQWGGTFRDKENVFHDIIIVFDNPKYGTYKLDKENDSFAFSYYKNDKKIEISGYRSGILSGDWWIYKLTEKEFTLEKNPLKDEIITLRRTF